MLIIPFRESSNFREQIQLSGTLFYLKFTWNALNEFWLMDIYNSNELPLILGVKIVPEYPLIYQFVVDGKPIGEIVCHNVVNAPSEIGRFDMNQKFALVYYEPGELQISESILAFS